MRAREEEIIEEDIEGIETTEVKEEIEERQQRNQRDIMTEKIEGKHLRKKEEIEIRYIKNT